MNRERERVERERDKGAARPRLNTPAPPPTLPYFSKGQIALHFIVFVTLPKVVLCFAKESNNIGLISKRGLTFSRAYKGLQFIVTRAYISLSPRG